MLEAQTVEKTRKSIVGQKVRLRGWTSSKSRIGGVLFVVLRDGSGYIQLTGKKGSASEEELKKMMEVTVESAVEVVGTLKEDPRAPGGVEVSVEKFDIVAKADKWPITKSAVKSPAFLFDNRHLSIRGRRASSVIKVRSEIIYATFDFFTSRGFHLISAPSFVKNAVEGGATLFEVNYFDSIAYLSQSAQLYEEAAICGLEKVFIFQPAFRAEKSKTAKHLTEFWMIEAEQAFADQEDNMRLQEDLVSHIAKKVVERREEELKILGRNLNVPYPPFPRLSYDEAHHRVVKGGVVFEWGEDLPTEAEKVLAKDFDTPFFITDYPLSARSFYHMTRPEDDRITLSADLYAPEGYGEILTGGQRIHEYSVLEKRLQSQGISMEEFRWYLDLRRYGLPPHSGFGLGVERMTRWLCGLKHIRSASLFPRTITRLTP